MPTGAEIIASAKEHLGKDYVYGADGPDTFDCSGLVTYVFAKFGIHLPHHAADQAKRGKAVSADDIQPGDLVFSNWGHGGTFGHVGIAVSSSQIIVAPKTGDVVKISSLDGNYRSHITGVRRIKGVTNTNSGAGTSGTGTATATTTPGASSSAGGGGATSAASGSADGGGSGGVFGAIADAIRTAFMPLTGLQVVSEALTRAFLPTNIMRVCCGVLGLVLIMWGVVLLAKEAK